LITWHPSEASLLSYGAGAMPEALALVLATHLAQCEACQHTMATIEAVGGVLLDALPPEPMAASALDPEALDRLLDRDYEPPAVPPVLHAGLPAPLDRVPMGRWWPIGIGLRFRPLRVGGRGWGGLILGRSGQALPRHGHDGLELTCVLRGAFADSGRMYAAGDLSEPEEDHDHPPVVVSAEPCLCVIASEGIRLRGLFGMAQRLMRL
jgi:putative transcriptional regulator